jgi:DNA-binding beta-propeller fold protein YncE
MGRRNIWIFVAAAVLLTHTVSLTAQTAIVVNQGMGGTGNVSVIAPNLTVTTVSLAAGSIPVDIAANPAGTLAAIADLNGPSIQFLDLTMNPPILSGPSVSVAGSGGTARPAFRTSDSLPTALVW